MIYPSKMLEEVFTERNYLDEKSAELNEIVREILKPLILEIFQANKNDVETYLGATKKYFADKLRIDFNDENISLALEELVEDKFLYETKPFNDIRYGHRGNFEYTPKLAKHFVLSLYMEKKQEDKFPLMTEEEIKTELDERYNSKEDLKATLDLLMDENIIFKLPSAEGQPLYALKTDEEYPIIRNF